MPDHSKLPLSIVSSIFNSTCVLIYLCTHLIRVGKGTEILSITAFFKGWLLPLRLRIIFILKARHKTAEQLDGDAFFVVEGQVQDLSFHKEV